MDIQETAQEALEKALWSLGETVGRAGRVAHETPHGATIVSELRQAHGEVETAILAAMAVTHNRGAAPQGIAPLMGFRWDSWGEANRQRFASVWDGVRSDAANVGDPDLHKRLQELWILRDERDPAPLGRAYVPPPNAD
jgi:hypothetical protein